MDVLVTGGAGFIGSHLVAALRERGDRPLVLDDGSSGDLASVPSDVPVIVMDIADPDVVAAIAGVNPAAIIHAAAQASVPRSQADPARDRAVNVVGTAHVLEAARAAGTARVVFISSGGAIYGEANGADERTLPRPASYYGAHKYLAERYVELSGLSYGIARPANVYGPGQRAGLEGGVAAIFVERLLAGQPIDILGTGEQYRDFVYVTDVVRSLLAMLDTPRCGLWNVGTGAATTINALLAALEARLGRAVAVRHEPPRAGDVYASRLDVARIRTDLGWEPRYDLDAGLADMLQREGALR